jgi:hypothetical protein
MAAMFSSGEVDFNKAAEAQLPTKGRAIDHFGLEVKGIEAFCEKLSGAGVKFETALHIVPGTGVKSAFIVDPAGARIELTEGLPPHQISDENARALARVRFLVAKLPEKCGHLLRVAPF